jgi:hypothetical protein
MNKCNWIYLVLQLIGEDEDQPSKDHLVDSPDDETIISRAIVKTWVASQIVRILSPVN